MKIETCFESESKSEAKTLRMMHLNMQDAGMDLHFVDGEKVTRLYVKESRRKRRSSQEVIEAESTKGT